MIKIETKICKKCKSIYKVESGGIVATPDAIKDNGLCEKCRAQGISGIIGSIIGNK